MRERRAIAFNKSGHPGLARRYQQPVLDSARDFPEVELARTLYAKVETL